jgi:hypothetical protein
MAAGRDVPRNVPLTRRNGPLRIDSGEPCTYPNFST